MNTKQKMRIKLAEALECALATADEIRCAELNAALSDFLAVHPTAHRRNSTIDLLVWAMNTGSRKANQL